MMGDWVCDPLGVLDTRSLRSDSGCSPRLWELDQFWNPWGHGGPEATFSKKVWSGNLMACGTTRSCLALEPEAGLRHHNIGHVLWLLAWVGGHKCQGDFGLCFMSEIVRADLTLGKAGGLAPAGSLVICHTGAVILFWSGPGASGHG